MRHVAIELYDLINVYMYHAEVTYAKLFLDSLYYNYGLIAGSFVISVISYLITVLCFRRRNAKIRTGGALEYEFL